MADASTGVSDLSQSGRPAERVWVLDDPRNEDAAQAIGIAERLGVPFRRVALAWTWLAPVGSLAWRGSLLGLAAAGEGRGGTDAPVAPRRRPDGALAAAAGPVLAFSSDSRSARVALWLKAHAGGRIVHCGPPGLSRRGFDLLVVPRHDQPPQAANILPVLGVPHRLAPLLLHQARLAWAERLAHLPRPRVTLLVGGPREGVFGGAELQPAAAHALGVRVAGLARQAGGAVLALTFRRTGAEATDALAAALAPALHVLHRWGEPGPDPLAAFLAASDAAVVTGQSETLLSQACAIEGPVFLALPELAGARERRLHASLLAAGQVRALGGSLSPWPRRPLDEAGRAAQEIIRRFAPG